jgi:uncharacterized repeat protein (TIGR01451 family)
LGSEIQTNSDSYSITNLIEGEYYVSISDSGDCSTSSYTVTVGSLSPTASISYNSPFCSTYGLQAVNLIGTGNYAGGAFSSVPSGLTLDATTGDVTPSTSTPGTYTVTYTIPASNGCSAVSTTTTVTVTPLPTATITYSSTNYCTSISTGQAPTLTGTGAYTIGTYSATPVGLTINTTTGAITPSTSTPGTYQVTYTIPAANGCSAISTTATVTITPLPTATISYNSPFCNTQTTSQMVTLYGTGSFVGGVFSSIAGLSLNATTGAITPGTSVPGTYYVTYTIPASGGCPSATAMTTVDIITQQSLVLFYNTPLCSTDGLQFPFLFGNGTQFAGGTFFSSPVGLTINSNTGEINPSTSLPGDYTITCFPFGFNGCSSFPTSTNVTIQSVNVSVSLNTASICSGGSATLIASPSQNGGTYYWSTGETTPSITVSPINTTSYSVTYSLGFCSYSMDTTTVTVGQSGSFSVTTFNDIDQNCSQNAEPGIEGILVSIQPGNYIAISNAGGIASFDSLPDGSYTATVDTTNLNWSATCPISQNFTIQNGMADCMSFGLTNNNPCTDPEVSIYAPFLRRCLPNQNVFVSACNQTTATGVLNASYVDVELDPLMTVTASSLPYIAQGNNIYRFQTGDLNPGQCASINITTTISCNAMLGQTLCMDANLYPVESCALDTEPTPMATGVTPCNLPWDQSSLSVNGWCQGDSVYFTITNTGQLGGGDMECYSPVRVYVDGVLTYFDSIMIQGGTTVTYSYFGNGQTWILQADQHPLHPGNSHPNAHVEGCGDVSNWTPDLVNNFPQDDADPVVDIYCGLVTGSYDPNDKTGFPLGIGQSHDILPNTDLQYVIRFQNTGTDTAFTVVIRDTLDTDLNIFTVTSGVSSHNYSFTMHGPRVLEWTFNNINLPDSSANEPESHGFVTFQVKQVPDLSAGTEINNNVGIYFDFNAPVITNTTLHTINPCINTITQTTNSSPYACSTYTAPNGQVLSESGTYQIISQDANGCNTIHNISLSISAFEAAATLVGLNTLQSSSGVTYQWIDCSTGQYLTSATNPIVTVVNGEYAVIVSDGQCSDQSECITVNTIGIEEGELSLNLHPNPSNGLVIVEALGIQPSEYTILSMDGRIIHSGLLHNGLTALDLNHFTNGTYLFNSNGKQIRFVISK